MVLSINGTRPLLARGKYQDGKLRPRTPGSRETSVLGVQRVSNRSSNRDAWKPSRLVPIGRRYIDFHGENGEPDYPQKRVNLLCRSRAFSAVKSTSSGKANGVSAPSLHVPANAPLRAKIYGTTEAIRGFGYARKTNAFSVKPLTTARYRNAGNDIVPCARVEGNTERANSNKL